MKGLNLCGALPPLEKCLLDDTCKIAIATDFSLLIGVYMLVDLFVGNDDTIYVQEYTTNHMNGLRHSSSIRNKTTSCIDPCFLGRMWRMNGGNQTMGSPFRESDSADIAT